MRKFKVSHRGVVLVVLVIIGLSPCTKGSGCLDILSSSEKDAISADNCHGGVLKSKDVLLITLKSYIDVKCTCNVIYSVDKSKHVNVSQILNTMCGLPRNDEYTSCRNSRKVKNGLIFQILTYMDRKLLCIKPDHDSRDDDDDEDGDDNNNDSRNDDDDDDHDDDNDNRGDDDDEVDDSDDDEDDDIHDDNDDDVDNDEDDDNNNSRDDDDDDDDHVDDNDSHDDDDDDDDDSRDDDEVDDDDDDDDEVKRNNKRTFNLICRSNTVSSNMQFKQIVGLDVVVDSQPGFRKTDRGQKSEIGILNGEDNDDTSKRAKDINYGNSASSASATKKVKQDGAKGLTTSGVVGVSGAIFALGIVCIVIVTVFVLRRRRNRSQNSPKPTDKSEHRDIENFPRPQTSMGDRIKNKNLKKPNDNSGRPLPEKKMSSRNDYGVRFSNKTYNAGGDLDSGTGSVSKTQPIGGGYIDMGSSNNESHESNVEKFYRGDDIITSEAYYVTPHDPDDGYLMPSEDLKTIYYNNNKSTKSGVEFIDNENIYETVA
ncbi:protein PFC0760c [Patella vulgata]|uniref:protein PFC0760c n=1 Tax=Patella vulgata TaxID=6465 RepID=UPI00217FBC8F|nr:protein PFC0760c [Patella vulgata]